MSVLSEEEFFHYLLNKTKATYLKSELHVKHPDSTWGYAVCDTPIQKGAPVLLGLNWGDKNKTTQTEYPPLQKQRKWRFVTHSRKYLNEYMGVGDVNELFIVFSINC